MSADKRSVSTDALATLGTIIEEGGRDAIHLAVEPVIAAHQLHPGEHIGIVDGKASGQADKFLGIVDPFLTEPVKQGQKFWLIVYPRQITSLRHVWEHPDFPDEKALEIAKAVTDKLLGGSEQWIREFAEQLDMTYNALMRAASNWAEDGDYTYDNSETYKNYPDKFPEFWEHYEKVTGKKVDIENQRSFFTCSC